MTINNYIGVAFFALVASVLVALSGRFIVTEGNVGVVYHLGSLQETIYPPGLHRK